ncbi:putative NUDIX family NTP pyrophosphohydrolase [Stackebrandtia albiflava]|uniref:Putative NUDIX family NTP pyrophosphohydrolase n=1 Tax=Stackebrandtia albiflava TaxID=406432 RepID=A0A562VAU4_9ACTN|nr:putative NUDIX family NTP pyrophosphohydrolase [Stackebrandtia albiflava]
MFWQYRRVATRSAGILLYRRRDDVEVLIGHMGGPWWTRRDHRAWSIPKGEYTAGEEPLAAARREFQEELGVPVPAGPVTPLGEIRQSGGKHVTVWAIDGEIDEKAVRFGEFEMEWPPGSGTTRRFPELDRIAWTDLPTAAERLVAAQAAFLDRLRAALAAAGDRSQ